MSKIIEKVRIVTFRGTEEQVSKQEGLSRPFGILNSLDKIKDNPNSCEVKVEDASSIDLTDKKPFIFEYTNCKNETSIRKVIPIQPRFEVNEFHGSEPLWLLKCYDLDKYEIRYFDMSKIKGVS